MKKLVLLLGLFVFLSCFSIGHSQIIQGTSITTAWDLVTGATSYNLYYKLKDGGTPVLADKVTTNRGVYTFSADGSYVVGVSSVKTFEGATTESTICWSDDTTCTFNGTVFGVQCVIPIERPINYKPVTP